MLGDTFKDLSKGDRVKYDYKEYYTKERKVGEGTIYGFGSHGYNDFVWVMDPFGKLNSIPYEEIEKI